MVDISYPFSGRRRWATGFSVGFISLFIGLGVWQLDRARYKATLQAAMVDNGQLPIIELGQSQLTELTANPLAWRYRRVALHGHYDERYIVYLDNRVHQGVAGYQVLTPFVLTTGETVMINRGWIAAGARDRLPTLQTVTDTQKLTVRLYLLAHNSFTLGDIADSDQWPQRWTHLNDTVLKARLPLTTLPVWAQLMGSDQGSTLIAQPFTVKDTWVARHKGYALQWFLMALVLAALYARLLWRMRSA